MKFNILFLSFFCTVKIFSQTPIDSSKTEEEDFSMYADVVDAPSTTKSKVYCSQKILGLSPSKLISLGFDFVGANTLDIDSVGQYFGNEANVKYNSGTRFSANFPVISNNKMILSLGVNYLDFKYNVSSPENKVHPLIYSLHKNGLRSYGINATLFKPFNSKLFGILQLAADHNNAGKIDQFNVEGLRYSGAAIFGSKPHDRLQYGIGITQSYRGGALNYFPVVLYNYTFKSKRWGIEMLLPARANLRYTINARNLLFAGFELEGNSYFMNPMLNEYSLGYKNLQLHRSEIRPRLTYEFSIYNFIWMSIQAGYRVGFRFNLDDVDYQAEPVIMNNKVGGSYYFNISINLVSP
jgi:hypothetical protein